MNRTEQGMNTPKPTEPVGEDYTKKPVGQEPYKQPTEHPIDTPTSGTVGSGGTWGIDTPPEKKGDEKGQQSR